MAKADETKTRYRPWLFTYHNWTEEDIEYLRSEVVPKVVYVIWGKELTPTHAIPHLQGFLSFKDKKAKSQVLSLLSFPSGPVSWVGHVDVDNGCAKYSTKDGDYEEHGVRPATKKRKAQSAGQSLKDKHAHIRDLARAGDLSTLGDLYPGEYVRMYRTLNSIALDHKVPVPVDWVPGGEPYNPKWQWQLDLIETLNGPVHPREIIWIYDIVGDYGKSDMATYLACNRNAFVIDGGKTGDIAHAYRLQKIVVFDFARTTDFEKVNYGVIEHLKNGRLFSPKYDSTTKYFPKPHVVVFANRPCPEGKFSVDRLRSINIGEPSPYAVGFVPSQVSVPAPAHKLSEWPVYSDHGIERNPIAYSLNEDYVSPTLTPYICPKPQYKKKKTLPGEWMDPFDPRNDPMASKVKNSALIISEYVTKNTH